jgi:hypothetical protein
MSIDVGTTGQETQDAKIAIDLADGNTVYLALGLDTLCAWINGWIDSAMVAIADPNNATPKNQMMRMSLNSALIAIGPMIAKMFWRGEGDPPRPGRRDDLMMWYVQFVAEQIVSSIEHSSSMLHLEATDVTKDDSTATIRIHSISARSAAGR